MMRALAGDARISFEGDLRRCKGLYSEPGASHDETDALRRNTAFPVQDFVVLPLEPETTNPIMGHVLPDSRVIHDVIHIQIEKDGTLQFGAYDNFHDDCIVCGSAVPADLLDELQSKLTIRSWQVAPKDAHR